MRKRYAFADMSAHSALSKTTFGYPRSDLTGTLSYQTLGDIIYASMTPEDVRRRQEVQVRGQQEDERREHVRYRIGEFQGEA